MNSKFFPRSFLIVFMFHAWNSIVAQTGFDSLMTRRTPNCVDIAYNSTILFKDYIERDKKDSASMLLTYWDNKCYMNEFLQRAKILFALKYNSFNDSILDDNYINYIANFQERLKYKIENIEEYYKNIFFSFDDFTMSEAVKLKNKYEEGTIEYLLSRLYSGSMDSIFYEIQKPKYGFSKIHTLYVQELTRCKKYIEFNWAFIGGAWIPTGAASNLGVHPELGIQAGLRFNPVTYDLTMAFRFLNTPEHYLARRKYTTGAVESTNYFVGMYLGLDVGFIAYETQKKEVHLLGGVGWDGFNPFPNNPNDNSNKSEMASSYNFNFGGAYRFYLNNKNFISLQVKYNIVDYTLNEVVDFTGNTFTIRLLVGGISGFKRKCLQTLQYSGK